MPNPLIARFAREDEAEAAMDATAQLPPDLFAQLSAMMEDEARLSNDGGHRVCDGEPVPFLIEPGTAVALAELASAVGLRPEQYLEQLIKRHVRARAGRP